MHAYIHTYMYMTLCMYLAIVKQLDEATYVYIYEKCSGKRVDTEWYNHM